MNQHQPLASWVPAYLRLHPQHAQVIGYVVSPPSLVEVSQEFPEVNYESELAAGETLFARDASDGQGHGLTVLALYLIARRNDTPHSFAMMLATQRAPGIETTDTFWAGRKRFDEVYGEPYANNVRCRLAECGVSLGATDEYMPELARYLGDPEAVVPFSGARDYIRSTCQRRGWEVNGAVTAKAREPLVDPHSPEGQVPLAESLVTELASTACEENPSLRRKPKQLLREMIIDKHGPSK